jgi:hypothetical protein
MRIVNIVGARPNFVKIAPLIRAMTRRPAFVPTLIHTGQHYDQSMSEQFFQDLEIRPPDFNLEVGSGSHALQTAQVMQPPGSDPRRSASRSGAGGGRRELDRGSGHHGREAGHHGRSRGSRTEELRPLDARRDQSDPD